MKAILAILLLLITFNGGCQDIDEFIRRSLTLIESPGEFEPDSSGLYKLPPFNYMCQKSIMNDDVEYVNRIRLLDINFDNKIDILFSGPCNPYNQAGIFLNRVSYFQRVFDRGGVIVDVEQREGKTNVFVLYEGCCGDINNEVIEIVIDNNSKVTKRTVHFLDSTKPVGAVHIAKLLVNGFVRKTPEIDDSPVKDPDSENWFMGNQIMKLDYWTEVIQLQTKGDWSLVAVEKEIGVFVLGWIKRSK